MNRKLATLLFAMGVGASASSAMAQIQPGCGWTCQRNYQACVRNGYDALQCDLDRLDCLSRCGI